MTEPTRIPPLRTRAGVQYEQPMFLPVYQPRERVFQLAETPGVLARLDGWIRHRLRALQLKQWKRGRTIFRELRRRGLSRGAAAKVAAYGRCWWKNSAMAIHIALPNSLFVELGVPRLAA